MEIIVLIFGILLILAAFLNMIHFIQRRKETKKSEQNYFIILFLIFILAGANYVFIGITDIKYASLSYGISLLFLFYLLAAGLSLMQQKKWAKPLAYFGIIYTVIFISLAMSQTFESWGIEELANSITNNISGLISFVALGILGYFFFKTRLSALLGLFIGILLPIVQFLLIVSVLPDMPAIYTVAMLFVINVIMYLGFKGKLAFFEHKVEN